MDSAEYTANRKSDEGSETSDTLTEYYRGPSGLYYVASHRKIRWHYLCSVWFFLDVFSIAPSAGDYMESPENQIGANSTGNFTRIQAALTVDPQSIMLLKMVRIARLTKLIRLLKYERIYVRFMSRISLSHSSTIKIKITVSVILVAHWFACIFALSASIISDPRETYWYTRGYCDDSSTGVDQYGQSVDLFTSCNLTPGRFYIACFTWAMLVVTGCGGTDEFPSSTSDSENVLVTCLNMIAALFWTAVLASFCDMVTNSNPELAEFQQSLDELEVTMQYHDFPIEMRRRFREYFHQRKHVRMAQRAFEVTQQLSTKLQVEATLMCYGGWLSKIPFLKSCDPHCVVQIALTMRAVVFAPSEMPPRGRFYVLRSGLVSYASRLVSSGKMWGIEALTFSMQEPATRATCLTYVNAFSITRDELWEILEQFPESGARVKRALCLLALRVKMLRMANIARFNAEMGNDVSGEDSPGKLIRKDTLSRILDTSSADELGNYTDASTPASKTERLAGFGRRASLSAVSATLDAINETAQTVAKVGEVTVAMAGGAAGSPATAPVVAASDISTAATDPVALSKPAPSPINIEAAVAMDNQATKKRAAHIEAFDLSGKPHTEHLHTSEQDVARMDRIESEVRESRSDARRMENELHGLRGDVKRILELLARGQRAPTDIAEATTLATLVKNPSDVSKVESAMNNALLRVRSVRKMSTPPSGAEQEATPSAGRSGGFQSLRDKHRQSRLDLGV